MNLSEVESKYSPDQVCHACNRVEGWTIFNATMSGMTGDDITRVGVSAGAGISKTNWPFHIAVCRNCQHAHLHLAVDLPG